MSWAFFNRAFTDFDTVTVTGAKSGLSLPSNADVKLHGMIVGELRDSAVENGKIKLTLGMDPELIDKIPAGVSARIVPKTLFGEKFIDLIPPEYAVGGSLKDGDVITNATVPVEFEKFFNDIYPLLQAVPPEQLATTLAALANTLDGRGESLGDTLVTANTYLKKITPETETAVADVTALGKVSDAYGTQLDEVGRLLRNSSELSRMVVDMDSDLAEFFDETTSLSLVLRRLFKGIGQDWIKTAANSRQPLAVLEEYSSIFPCLMRGTDKFTRDGLDDFMDNGTLHIELVMIAPQPTAYNGSIERPIMPTEDAIEALDLTQPQIHGYNANGTPKGLGTICDELDAYARGEHPWTHAHPFPQIPGSLWQIVGVQNSHNGKLGQDSQYHRPAAGNLMASNLIGVDTPDERRALNAMAAGMTGVKAADVPDVASLLISPVVRGAGVAVR